VKNILNDKNVRMEPRPPKDIRNDMRPLSLGLHAKDQVIEK